MSNELKPCPFCGGEAEETITYADNAPMFYSVHCGNGNCTCRPSTQMCSDGKIAREFWNERRASIDNSSLLKEIERLQNENGVIKNTIVNMCKNAFKE